MHTDRECLTELEIGAYIDGTLTPEQKESVHRRIAGCEDCRKELSVLTRLVKDPEDMPESEIPEGLLEKIVALHPGRTSLFDAVVGFFKDTMRIISTAPTVTLSTPVPAGGLRQMRMVSPRLIVLTRTFDEIDVELDIEKTGDDLCTIRVVVADARTKKLVKRLRAELFSNGRVLASENIVGQGVAFEDLGPGRYVVRIEKKGAPLGEVALKIE